MMPSSTKLISCLGYSLRLAKRTQLPTEVTDRLQQALHHLLLFMEDNRSQQLVEREAKRGLETRRLFAPGPGSLS